MQTNAHSHSEALDARQQRAAQLLSEGNNGRQVCAALKVNEATLVRWRKTKAFRQYLEKLLAQVEADSVTFVTALRGRAAERMSLLLDSTDEHVAFKAARCVLEQPTRGAPQPELDDEEMSAFLESLGFDAKARAFGGLR